MHYPNRLFLIFLLLLSINVKANTSFDSEYLISADIDSGYILYNNTELIYAHDESSNYVFFKTFYNEIKTLDDYSRTDMTYIHFYVDTEETVVLRLEYGQNDDTPYLIEIDKYTGKIIREGIDPRSLKPIPTEQQISRYEKKLQKDEEKKRERIIDFSGKIFIVFGFFVILVLILVFALVFRKKK